MSVLGLMVGNTEPVTGEVSYMLARRARIKEYRKGTISRSDVCDAHPELLRVGMHHGKPRETKCPVCTERSLCNISYVFGTRLPAQGRVITSVGDMERIKKRKGTFTCYIVEICTTCRWNHLLRAVPVV